MSSRNLLILAVALVALVALVLVGQRDRSSSPTNGELLVPTLAAKLNDVDRVTVVKAGGETVATVERRADGWVVPEKSAYTANVGKLRQSLVALSEARILEQKTANPSLYSRLGVEDVASDDAKGVEITLAAGGNEIAKLILGNADGSKLRYVRRAGEMQSYLVDRNPDVPREGAQWLDTGIIDVRSDRMQQITITHPDGEVLTVSKSSREASNFDVAGVPEGRELLYPGVANVIGNSLRELNLEDVEAVATAAAPAEEPVAVEFRTFDGLVVRALGIEHDDGKWVTFEASVDTERAAAAPPAAEGASDAPAADAVDPTAEAASINAKVGGWRYRIANFQYDQMTRRMADLLKPPA